MSGAQHLCSINLKTLTINQLKSETALFQSFIQKYYKADQLQSDRAELKELYAQAKQLADII